MIASFRKQLVALAAALPLALALTTVYAQTPQEVLQSSVERKERGPLMNERSYKRYEAATSLYSDNKYSEALKAVQSYLSSDVNDYERALGEQLYGYILIGMDRLKEATPHFEKAVQLDSLQNSAHFGLMKSLAQLYASEDQWQKSIDMMVQYLKFHKEPAPEDLIIVGQSYAQMERYRDALPWVQLAIEKAGAKAQESWYKLAVAIHFEMKNYRAAVDTLKLVVARWPNKLEYWELLSGAHQELNQDQEAAAALLTAYHNGLIDTEGKLLNVARMSMYVETPYHGGRIIERGMADKQIEANQKNLETLLQMWSAAREYGKAGAVIDRLGPMTGNGELFIQKATMRMELNDWRGTIDAAQKALEVGNVKNPGNAWLMTGIAYLELGELKEAKDALKQAQQAGDEKVRRQAREWEQFVDDRISVMASR